MTHNIRPRAAAAVLRNDNTEILLVQHLWSDGTTSWILPGGGLLPGEQVEEAALRELFEETGLRGSSARFLFDMPYKLGISSTFLVEADHTSQASLGNDPEDEGKEQVMLQALAWFPIAEVAELPEVQRLLSYLDIKVV